MIYLFLTWLFAPLLRWRAGFGPREPQRILLVQTAKIGDMICTTPLFTALRRAYPSAKLIVLADPLTTPLIAAHPDVDEVWAHRAKSFKGFSGRLALYRLLRQARIDTTVCVSPNQMFLTMPLWAGVARRMSILPNEGGGASYRMAARFLSHGETHVAGRSVLQTELALLAQIGVAPYAKKSVPVADAARQKVADLLPKKEGRWAGLGISSGNKLKALDDEQLAEFIRGLQVLGYRVVLVGSGEDRPIADRLIGFFPDGGVIDAAGRFSLSELSALIATLDLYIGVDSGITYLADALEVPLIDMMGPADADDQSPNGEKAWVVRSDLACAPCSHAFDAPYSCRMGHRGCVVRIDPREILDQWPDS